MTMRTAWVLAVAGGLFVLGTSVSRAQLQPCPDGGNCVQVTVGSGEGCDSVQIPISFQQAADDGAAGGPDEIAALAMTLGIAGLELADCDSPDANGITSAIQIPSSVADGYRVVVENTSCTDRERCLCPGAGQTRDDFVNIVVFGPKDLPTPGSGPVDIPLLPDGELLSLNLKISSGASGVLPLHVFNETDDQGTTPKPQFGAFLSIGDKEAVDQTADRDANESKVTITDGQVTANCGACACDCDLSGRTTGTEITKCVLILGGQVNLSECLPADSDNNGRVSGTDITRGVIALGLGSQCQPVPIGQ